MVCAENAVKFGLKIEAVTISDGDRLILAVDAREKAKWAAKRIEWMRNPDRQHGQQAKECAEKTMRALSNGSLSASQLFAKCEEFSRLRKRHIDRNNAKKPRAKARSIDLPIFNMVARWLVSDMEISQVGKSMGNCLADKGSTKDYKSRLRLGNIELIVLESDSGECHALISLDAWDNRVEHVKGPGNIRAIKCREPLISALTHRKVGVDGCSDLLALGICDGLLTARAAGTSEQYTIDQRECEVGSGFVAIIWGENTILLRSEGCHYRGSKICVISPDSEDTNYVRQAAARVWLRNACYKHPDFAISCWAAFQTAPEIFCLDWFGALNARLTSYE